jgi:hypothetical protein
MSWRQTQLGQSFCDQDRLILELFGSSPVKYVSRNLEFAEHLNQSDCSENLILIINQPIWCSELITLCKTQLTSSIKTFYIGVNRYCIKGNDTTVEFTITEHKGKDIIDFVDSQIQTLDYSVKKSGHFDQDLGRYFNFVQPITWLYGNKTTN